MIDIRSLKDARSVIDRRAISSPVLSRPRSSGALGSMTVSIIPGLRIDEAELVGRDPHYFSVIPVESSNPAVEGAREQRRKMGNTRKSSIFRAWEPAQGMEIDTVDASSNPTSNQLSRCVRIWSSSDEGEVYEPE